MGNTAYSDITDLRTAEALSGMVIQLLAARDALPNHPALMYAGSAEGSGSAVVKVPHIGLEGYNTLAATSDGAAVTATTISDGATTITVARKSRAYAPTDLAKLTGPAGQLDAAAFASDAVRSAAATLVELVAAVTDGFTTTVGSTTVNLVISDFLAAKAALANANVPGPYLCILHPQQWADLVSDIATNDSNGSVVFDPASPEAIARLGTGFQGDLFGVQVFTSTFVPTANAAADRAGGMFGRGAVIWADAAPIVDVPDSQILLGGKILFERDRDALSGLTNYVTHAYMGVSKGIDSAGVSIISDA